MRCIDRAADKRIHPRPFLLAALLAASLALGPAPQAQAESFRGWVGVRGDYFSGSSDLFTEFDNVAGFGLDLGIELVSITIFGEALFMGADQYLFTGNIGYDHFWGEGARFGLGFFTGPLLMLFPESEAGGVDFSFLSPAEEAALLQLTGAPSLDVVGSQLDQFTQDEQDLGRLTFGWNLIRLRLSGDVPLGPLYLGLAGQIGYHLVISGEEVAAGAKNEAVDAYAADFGLPASLTGQVRRAVGAEPVDTTDLDGFNWDLHLYLRIEF